MGTTLKKAQRVKSKSNEIILKLEKNGGKVNNTQPSKIFFCQDGRQTYRMISDISGKKGDKVTLNCWGQQFKNLEITIGQVIKIKDVKVSRYNGNISLNSTRTTNIEEDVESKNEVEWNNVKKEVAYKKIKDIKECKEGEEVSFRGQIM